MLPSLWQVKLSENKESQGPNPCYLLDLIQEEPLIKELQ